MATPVKMLRFSKGMSTGTVLEWYKSPGERVRQGEPLLSVLSEKVDVQVDASASGVLLSVAVPAGGEVPVGTVLAWIGQPGETPGTEAPMSEAPPALGVTPESPPTPERVEASRTAPAVKASPVARRIAAEQSIDLQSVVGSGPGGLITRADVENAAPATDMQELMAEAPVPAIDGDEVERLPLTGIRKAMAARMMLSKRTAADVTTVVDVDMGAIRSLREHVPVTYTSAVVKAVALSLQEHRMLNASLAGEEILLHKRIHIGIAADTPRGLVVFTIADADAKSLRQVDDEVRQLTAAVRTGTLRDNGMPSPTFTVTNSGVFGSLMFTPIINPPQSATLGMGKVQDTPVVRNGEIVARPVMYLCLTYDHRIVTGAEGVRFLQDVKTMLEDPARMI